MNRININTVHTGITLLLFGFTAWVTYGIVHHETISDTTMLLYRFSLFSFFLSLAVHIHRYKDERANVPGGIFIQKTQDGEYSLFSNLDDPIHITITDDEVEMTTYYRALHKRVMEIIKKYSVPDQYLSHERLVSIEIPALVAQINGILRHDIVSRRVLEERINAYTEMANCIYVMGLLNSKFPGIRLNARAGYVMTTAMV